MTTRFPLLFFRAMIPVAVLASTSHCLTGFAKPAPQVKIDAKPCEVRVSRDDGLITSIFYTPSGGKVSVDLPLHVLHNDNEIGGYVDRQLPHLGSTVNAEATNEIAGVVTIEPHKKEPNLPSVPPITVPPNTSGFKCPTSRDGGYDVTYHPPQGPALTTKVECPLTDTPPSANTCGIPQLVRSSGYMHVTMAPNGDPSKNTCLIGGQPATVRTYSGEGATVKVPPAPAPASNADSDQAGQVSPGANSVVFVRGGQMAIGQTHVAQIKMTCSPVHLKPGQPCTVTTTAYCPGIHDVKDGSIVIKNYNPAVLNLADKVVPITNDSTSQGPSTNDLVKRDMLKSLAGMKQQLANSPDAATAEGQKLCSNVDRMQSAFALLQVPQNSDAPKPHEGDNSALVGHDRYTKTIAEKPVYMKVCNWRILKVMRVTREPGTSDKDWNSQLEKLGDQNLPDTDNWTSEVSKAKDLLDGKNKLNEQGLDKNQHIILLCACVGIDGYVWTTRAYDFPDTKAFQQRNMSDPDHYPDLAPDRLRALQSAEQAMNTPPKI